MTTKFELIEARRECIHLGGAALANTVMQEVGGSVEIDRIAPEDYGAVVAALVIAGRAAGKPPKPESPPTIHRTRHSGQTFGQAHADISRAAWQRWNHEWT
jgi:hypothetical protein